MPRGGQRGVWFDLPTTEMLSADHAARPLLERLLADQRSLITVRTQQTTELAAAEAARVTAQAAAKKALSEARADTAAATAWYRSPWLWAGLGAALGGFVTYEIVR
jgi:hypothetical protein